MSLDEVDGHCNLLSKILRQLVDDRNWGRKIGQVFGC